MENKLIKKEQLIMSVLVIVGFTITMIGGAYAYFSATVSGDAVTNTVEAALLAGIDFGTGQSVEIPDSGIYPGWIGVQSVTINKPNGITSGVGAYELIMTPTVDAGFNDWVSYEVYKTTDGDTITRVEGEVTGTPTGEFTQNDSLTLVGFTQTTDSIKTEVINSTSTKIVLDKQNYDMATFSDTTYYIVYYFESAGINQNSAMGKEFSSIVDVEIIEPFTVPATETITNLVGNGEVFDENGIRYQGDNPNNYVVFEEGGEVYRVIGVFDTLLADGTTTESLVKIIKEESIGSLMWDAGDVNDWNTSTLKTTLNTNFLNSTGSYTANGLNNQKEMITDVTWNLGGYTNYLTAIGHYNAERGTTVYIGRATTGTGSVGLIYASDYLFAVKESDCSRTLTSHGYSTTITCHDNNWMFSGLQEITISPSDVFSDQVWHIRTDGFVNYDNANIAMITRPSIYLNPDVSILSGTGSSIDPYVMG